MGKSTTSMKDFEDISLRDAFGKALVLMGEKVPELVLLGADSLGSTRGAAFAKRFPQRTFNFGIAEQEMRICYMWKNTNCDSIWIFDFNACL